MTRKSKREIKQEIDDLAPEPGDEYPHLDNLAMILGFDWEQVDGEEHLYERQDTGEVYYAPPETVQAITEKLFGDD